MLKSLGGPQLPLVRSTWLRQVVLRQHNVFSQGCRGRCVKHGIHTSLTVRPAAAVTSQAPPAHTSGHHASLRYKQNFSTLQEAARADEGVAKVVLKRGKTAVFRGGHPMVYSGAVDRVVGKPQPQAGDCVLVTDGEQRPIGWGVFNPVSWFRVRIMQLEHEVNQQRESSCVFNMQRLLSRRLHTAVQLRHNLGLCDSPSHPQTDTARPRSVTSSSQQSSLSNNRPNDVTNLTGAESGHNGSRQSTDSAGAVDSRPGTATAAASHDAAVALSTLLTHSADGSNADRLLSNGQASTSTSDSDISSTSGNSNSSQADSSNGGSSSSRRGSRGTDIYRLVNSEGDRLSGLVVDMFGDRAVIASSAAWVERYKDAIMQEVQLASGSSAPPVWKQSKDMLQEEGITVDAQATAVDDLEAEVQVQENGIRFWVSLSTGQKTGFYADQRDSRLAMRQLAQGKAVLDLCCYTGGFALNALAGGATHVTGVDSSASALALAERNAELNGWRPSQYTFLKNDIHKFMQQQVAEGRQWDLVVLDPPKLAPNKKALDRALNKYRKLNMLAMQVLKPGGLLMTCSCSGIITLDEYFIPVLKEAARAADRRISILRLAGAGPDHPVDAGYPEGLYLKNVLLMVS